MAQRLLLLVCSLAAILGEAACSTDSFSTVLQPRRLRVPSLRPSSTRARGAHHRKSGALRYYGAPFQFVTCEAAGNVLATGVAGTFGTVIAFPNGKESGAHMLPITSNGNLGGIKAEPNGDILVDNPGTVTEYTEDGTPTGRQLTTKDGWLDIALDESAGVIFGADQTAETA
jgi:hypothetical protein